MTSSFSFPEPWTGGTLSFWSSVATPSSHAAWVSQPVAPFGDLWLGGVHCSALLPLPDQQSGPIPVTFVTCMLQVVVLVVILTVNCLPHNPLLATDTAESCDE